MSTAPDILRLSDELDDLNLGDGRLKRRACKLIERLAQQPDRSIPAACITWEETKAAYRFLDHDQVTAQSLLDPHYRRTRERMMAHDIVLCIQDTTELDYTGKDDIQGLGTLNYPSRRGLYLHPTLAITPDRLPLGILDSWSWVRPFLDAEKESVRWLEGYQRLCDDQQYLWEQDTETRLIYMADREADLIGIYAEHHRRSQGEVPAPDWLIRAKHDRNLVNDKDQPEEDQGKGEESDEKKNKPKLWAAVEASPELGQIEFVMPSADKRKGRKVRQSLRATRVHIPGPGKEVIEITALLAREINPADGEVPIEWMLLTNRAITNQEQAEEALSWYLARWQIEIFFRILKSGCKIEQLQLEHIDRLEPAIMLYMLIAWRILYCTMVGRECPEMPCNLIFDDDTWQTVYVASRREPPPDKPPTLNEMIRMIAAFGGFLNRKSDGFPGPKTIWIGLQRSKDFAEMYAAIRAMNRTSG